MTLKVLVLRLGCKLASNSNINNQMYNFNPLCENCCCMSKKHTIKLNLDSLTSEQLDKVYQNVAEAASLLYKTVRERKIREMLIEFNQR